MQNKILKTILIAVLVALASISGYLVLTTEVPVVKNNVQAGEIIVANNIDTVRVFKGNVYETSIDKAVDLVGKTAKVSIQSNNVILANQVEDKMIEASENPEDTVVVALPVKPTHVPVDLKEGDVVNIIAYFNDGVVEGQKAWAVGFNATAKINSVTKDENNDIVRIDILIKKDMSVEIAASVSLGDIYVIKNLSNNNVNLEGTTAQDIYLKNFHIQVVNEEPELVKQPEVVMVEPQYMQPQSENVVVE